MLAARSCDGTVPVLAVPGAAGWAEEEVLERCVPVGGWQVTPSAGGTAAVPPCEVMRRRSPGFVARAFSWLLLDSKARVRCHFFPGSAPSFSRAREAPREHHGPQMITSGA